MTGGRSDPGVGNGVADGGDAEGNGGIMIQVEAFSFVHSMNNENYSKAGQALIVWFESCKVQESATSAGRGRKMRLGIKCLCTL